MKNVAAALVFVVVLVLAVSSFLPETMLQQLGGVRRSWGGAFGVLFLILTLVGGWVWMVDYKRKQNEDE
ncbi:hypothetical protein [Aliiroseovarius marinus]|uniref:hypothetical protein n=1 Tax=Aliiroseovarius marinus TaxID=2500159 RepID=UPI00105F39E4|nr:hypothetical protein [Aliiroseovarius marinus]